MEKLADRDYRNLLNCVAELYAHNDLDSFAEHLLAVVQKVVPADYSTFTEINERFKRVGCISNPHGLVPKATREEQARYFSEHPLWLHFTKTRMRTPAKISDYIRRPRWKETAFYREIFRSVGDFSEAERLKLALLRSHSRRAHARAERVTLLREQNMLLAESLVATRQALITLSANGAVLLCTEPARRYLCRYFGSPRNNKHLPEALRLWMRRQKFQSNKNRNGIFPPPEPFVVERNDGRLSIHLFSGQTAGRRILLMEERRAAPSAESLRRHLGLTPREAEVLFWVVQGKKSWGIGVLLNMSTATVEKHLEHIMAKLKVETRTAAARCAQEVFTGN